MIKNWSNFKESISGWELIGKDMGPNYPQQNLPTTLTSQDTTVIMGMDGNLYTEDDFNQLLQQVNLKNISRDFNKKNLDTLLFVMK